MSLELSAAQWCEIKRLREAAPGIQCVIIGAVAVNHHVRLPRSTGDVDHVLALDVADLRELLKQLGWKQHAKMKQRWIAEGFVADVLPASPELIAAGAVRLDDDDRAMSLAGFDLLFEQAEEQEFPDGDGSVLVAGLRVIAILKISAWLERPYDRKKDLHDLGTILSGALGEDDERRWEGTIPGDFEEQSPRFIGREVGRIVGPEHRALIELFLEKVPAEDSPWLSEMRRGMKSSILLSPRGAVEAFRSGLFDSSSGEEASAKSDTWTAS